MAFYETITENYDHIFPLKPPQASFVKAVAKEYGAKTMLDMGCATGALAAEMAKG